MNTITLYFLVHTPDRGDPYVTDGPFISHEQALERRDQYYSWAHEKYVTYQVDLPCQSVI